MIHKNECKIDIFSNNSGLFDTMLKILIPALQVVQVTNIRYVCKPCIKVFTIIKNI